MLALLLDGPYKELRGNKKMNIALEGLTARRDGRRAWRREGRGCEGAHRISSRYRPPRCPIATREGRAREGRAREGRGVRRGAGRAKDVPQDVAQGCSMTNSRSI